MGVKPKVPSEIIPNVKKNTKTLEHVELSGDVLELNLGPQHPSTHGVLRLKLKLDGEIVLSADR